MDFDSLKSTVSNLTLYDLKAGVRKVQNAVMNYTEMEAKVREATNNEPWGASSSLMQEIANGTFNYQQLNEIMPMIYKRFTEKAAEEWRQIYKALQLLEFLIKNGSERVIDDARSHLSLLKMLRQFHYIDQNGKDQGVNVRNRAKELLELLSDVEKIRAERKKARSNRNKYGGYEGGSMGLQGAGVGSSSFGGFGSDSTGYGGYSGGVYGDGGGFGGNASEYSETQSRRGRFEEYNEYDEGEVAPQGRRKADEPTSPRIKRESKNPESTKPKEPEVDLFSFDEPAPMPSASNGKTEASSGFAVLQSGADGDDDDFDDFQSATPAPAVDAPLNIPGAPSSLVFAIAPPASTSTTTTATQFAQPKPVNATHGQNLNDIFNTVSPPPQTNKISSTSSGPNYTPSASTPSSALRSPSVPTNYQQTQPNYYTSVAAQPKPSSGTSTPGSTFAGLGKPAASIGGGAKKAGGDPFANLLGGGGSSKQAQSGVRLADMAKQKSSAGLWGSSASPAPAPQQQLSQAQQQPQQKIGGGLDDLLG